MIFRISTAPSEQHPGAGQAALELHKHFSGSTFAAIRASKDKFLAVDDETIEISFNNPRRLENGILANILILSYRCLLLMSISIKMMWLFNKLPYQILHTHSPMYSLVAVFAKIRKRRVKCVLSIHGSEIHHLIRFRFLTTLLLRLYDDIFFVSQSDLRAFENAYPSCGTRLSYIGNGYNQTRFKAHSKHALERPYKVMILGSLRWQKNQNAAIEALSKGSLRNAFFLNIIGAGPDLASLQARVAELGLQDHVCFHGQLPASSVADIMSKNDFILSTSVTEGFPKAILEGMACGLVPIVPEVGEMPFLCQNGEGFVYARPNALGVSQILEEVSMISQDEFSLYSQKATDRAKEFSWANYVARHKELYNND